MSLTDHERLEDEAAYWGDPIDVVPARKTGWSAAELMGVDFPPVRWAVPGLLAEGVNLLAGAPKLGKSWLALNVGIAIAAGGKALGRIEVDQGDVLYLALEDTGRRLQNRLRLILGDEPAPGRLRLETACEAMHLGGEERLRAWLDKYPDTRLVAIDVLARIRGRVASSDNRYDSDYAAVAAVKALADEYGVSVLLVHHVRKASAEDFLESVSGTNGIAGAADAVLVLTRSRNTAQAVLKITGRDVEEAEHAMEFAPDLGAWQLLDGPASFYEMSDTRKAIVTALSHTEALGPKAIADLTGISHDAARQTLRRMIEAGQLDTDGNGNYFLPLSPVTPVTPSLLDSDTSDGSDTP